jgi:DNA (cytosine-5)-methyltransferase 1
MHTYGSLFSGIGGFELGIERAAKKLDIPVECVFSSEIDKNARFVYEKNFKKTPSGDITKISASDIPDFDILCGGFPCQDVSIAGKRAGLKGKRTGLFFDVIRIIHEKQPSIVFLENVKGLLNSNRGWDFARVLIELEDAGYSVEWDVLNSKDFGVPQNRERVYIIGHLRGRSAGKIFPIFGETGATTREKRTHIMVSPVLTPDRLEKRQNGRRFKNPDEPMFTLTAQDQHGVLIQPNLQYIGAVDPENKWLDNGKELSRNYPKRNRVYSAEGIATCLSSQLGGMSGGSGLYQVQQRIRKLTPVECERLQGFPDKWTEGIADTNRYKCLGNAVTVNVIEAIAEKILKELSDGRT